MSQNNIVKLAYDQGVQQALADFGLTKEAFGYDHPGGYGEDEALGAGGGAVAGGVGGLALGALLKRPGTGAALGALLGAGAGAGFGTEISNARNPMPSGIFTDNGTHRLGITPYAGSRSSLETLLRLGEQRQNLSSVY